MNQLFVKQSVIYDVYLIENVNKIRNYEYQIEWNVKIYFVFCGKVKHMHLFKEFVKPLSQSICCLFAKQYLLKNI